MGPVSSRRWREIGICGLRFSVLGLLACAPAACKTPEPAAAPTTTASRAEATAATIALPSEPPAFVPRRWGAETFGMLSAPTSRPFRAGILTLSPEEDAVQPLAVSALGAWTLHNDSLIGAFTGDWVGGYSLNPKKALWWMKEGTSLTSLPVVYGTSVVMGFRSGAVARLNAANGEVQWKVALDNFSNLPARIAGPSIFMLTTSQKLYHLDVQTGRTQWFYDAGFPERITVASRAAPVVYQDKVVIGLASGELLGIRIKDGKLDWRYAPPHRDARFHDIVGEIAVHQGRLIFARYDGLVESVTFADQNTAWRDEIPAISTSTYDTNHYLVGTVAGEVYAYDPVNGRRFWKAHVGQTVRSITTSEGLAYVAGTNGRIAALSLANGAIVWHDDVRADISSHPIFYRNLALFPTGIGNFFAYRIGADPDDVGAPR